MFLELLSDPDTSLWTCWSPIQWLFLNWPQVLQPLHSGLCRSLCSFPQTHLDVSSHHFFPQAVLSGFNFLPLPFYLDSLCLALKLHLLCRVSWLSQITAWCHHCASCIYQSVIEQIMVLCTCDSLYRDFVGSRHLDCSRWCPAWGRESATQKKPVHADRVHQSINQYLQVQRKHWLCAWWLCRGHQSPLYKPMSQSKSHQRWRWRSEVPSIICLPFF